MGGQCHFLACADSFIPHCGPSAMIDQAIECVQGYSWHFIAIRKYYPMSFYMPHPRFPIAMHDHTNVAEKIYEYI